MSNLNLTSKLLNDEAMIRDFPVRGMTTHVTVQGSNFERKKGRKKKYDDDELLTILRYAERSSFAKAALKHGISVATLYNFRKKLEEQCESDESVINRLTSENEKLRRLLEEKVLWIEQAKKLIANL